MNNPIAFAIPGFVALMAAESAVGVWKGRFSGPRPLVRWVDALTCLGCGVLSQCTGMFLTLVVAMRVYDAVGAWAPWHLPVTPVVAIASFILGDFVYYWWHRTSHRVNLWWAAHAVHHQSEDYNLAVALRQSVVTALTIIPFNLPFALLGFPRDVFFVGQALNLLYQFWIHTRVVGRLGALEWVFNTPSQHRVHHAVNPRYIDKNYAGVFSIWDRMFGTFVEEDAEPMYGTVEGFASADVVWANVEPYVKLFRNALAAGPIPGFRLLFAPPDWTPEGPRHIPEPGATLRWTPEAPLWTRLWTGPWFLVAAGCLGAALLGYHSENPLDGGPLLLAVLAAWTVESFGWLYERPRLWRVQEPVRVLAFLFVLSRL